MAFIKRGFGNVFIQADPTNPMLYLTSTGVGDITIPRRPRSVVYDPDVQRSGEFKATDFIRGEPSEITAAMQRPLDTVNNYLQEVDCPFNWRVNWACRGDRNIVWNYELAVVLVVAEFEGGSIGQPVIAQPSEDDRVQTSGDTKALGWSYIYLLTGAAHTTPGVTDIVAIACVSPECGGSCGRRINICAECYALCESGGYLSGDSVMKTHDGGGTWAYTPADPWLGARSPTDIIIVETASDYRIILTGGTLAATAASISYSDDYGVTWNDAAVGAVVAQSLESIARDELGYLWVVGSGGYVYRSTNLGLSWTAMYSADETAEDLYGVVFVSEHLGFVVGDGNDVIVTGDGGATWTLLVGPAVGANLMSIAVNNADIIFVSTSTGMLYYTDDEGATWNEVVDMGGGEITDIEFDPKLDYVGFMNWTNAEDVGVVMRSEDGGMSWMAWTTPTNTGLAKLAVCDPNTMYTVGDAGYIAKFQRSAA